VKHIKNIDDFISEIIKVPIKVGDTILGGRFKNKKTVVKKIGKNDKGDITINGKPLLKYRIIKESLSKLEEDVNSYLAHLIDSGFSVDISENILDSDEDNRFKRYFIKIFKPTELHQYTYSCKDFDWSEIEEETSRFISIILDEWDFDIEYVYSMVSRITENDRGSRILSLDRNMIDVDSIINGSANLDKVNSFTIGIIGD